MRSSTSDDGGVDDPFVRAVARLPITVRSKLLIAFVGTSLLLVAVGLLGQLVLGQSNDRVVSLGALRERAIGYGQLQRDVSNLRNLLAENVGEDFYKVWTEVETPGQSGGDRSIREFRGPHHRSGDGRRSVGLHAAS